MTEEWDRPPQPASVGYAVRVAAVVPLPAEMGGAEEVLALAAFGSVKLPSGEPRVGEGILPAAQRIVLGATGARVIAEKVVYVHEAVGRGVTLCVLCALDTEDDPDPRPGVRFVSPRGSDDVWEPFGVQELLSEDLRGGFVRPMAYIQVRRDEFGRERADASW
jgi:ADP-ribose pyrophosphatase YjhB (NUDIX family)